MSDISITKARTIIRKALATGRELGLKPLSVVVLDAGGHVKAFEREDGASPGRFGIAHGKAYGSVMLGHGRQGTDGRGRKARPISWPRSTASMAGRSCRCRAVCCCATKKGGVIGAVGVTGDTSDNDVIAAMAGIEAAGLIGEA
jgi:Uncharacterized protein, possibly involved in utilization of glycolate and propanediol